MSITVEEAVGSLPAAFGGEPLFATRLPIVRAELPRQVREVSPEVGERFAEILGSGLLTNGSHVRRFEQLAAEALGTPECVAVSSCTAGLMLVMRCLGLRGEVILPSFTFFASGHAALWNNLDPVLADCEADTFNLDPARVRELITPRTAAILAVHIFGNPAPARELEAIAREHNLRLIFDAAHGFGARTEGRPVGAGGDAEVFSLSPTKLLVAGEGGLVATRDRDLARRLRAARNYGDGGTYDCEVLGFNARMTEMQAVLAAAGLADLEARVERRNATAEIYQSRLAGEPGLEFQQIRPGGRSSRKDFAVLVDPERCGVSREFLRAALERENIEVRSYFDPPLHRQQLYRNCRRGDLTETERISRQVLNLPIYSSLAPEAAAAIASRILAIGDEVGRRGYPEGWRPEGWRNRTCRD